MPLIIYNNIIEKRLKRLLQNGVPIAHIAKHFGVTRPTIYNWMKKPEIKIEVELYKTYIKNLFEN